MLKAKKPTEKKTRLKLMMFSPAGVGKTTAALAMPKPYIIDTEAGTDHYREAIEAAGGVVLETTSIAEITQEVRALLTEKHEYKTLVLDPITPVWDEACDFYESKVGSDWGRHIAAAGKDFKRLFRMLADLDMNVVLTAHAKGEFEMVAGEKGRKERVQTGNTFDGWKKLDYLFDLVLELERDPKDRKKRWAKVVKTRLPGFPDQERFLWGYDEISKRYDPAKLEKSAAPMKMATEAQVNRICDLADALNLRDTGVVDKWFKKADVERFEDMTHEDMEKCISWCEDKVKSIHS